MIHKVYKRKTPKGDGNYTSCFVILFLLLIVYKRKTPKGDGNELQLQGEDVD